MAEIKKEKRINKSKEKRNQKITDILKVINKLQTHEERVEALLTEILRELS